MNSIDTLSGGTGAAAAAVASVNHGRERESLDAMRQAAEGGRAGEAAKRFEEYFATLLVREMRRGLPNGFFQGPGADTFNAWMDEHIGASLTHNDALGIAGMVKAALGPQAYAEAKP